MYALSFVFLALMLCYSQSKPAPEEQESYEAQLERIVEEMSNCMDKNLEPIMSQLSQADQRQWKYLGISALSEYVRHLGILAAEEKLPETKRQPLRRAYQPDSHESHRAEYGHPTLADDGAHFGPDYDVSTQEATEEIKIPRHPCLVHPDDFP